MQPNMLWKCQWYCDFILGSYTYGHRRICEVTRLLFIMHKFHIELNHNSKYKMQYIIYTKSTPKRLFYFSLWKAFFHNRHLFIVMPFWCLCGIEWETVYVYIWSFCMIFRIHLSGIKFARAKKKTHTQINIQAQKMCERDGSSRMLKNLCRSHNGYVCIIVASA